MDAEQAQENIAYARALNSEVGRIMAKKNLVKLTMVGIAAPAGAAQCLVDAIRQQ